jgi:hypothetical protein
VPGKRHQRRQGFVEKRSPHQEPRRDPVPAGGTTATAHKIAVIFYTTVQNQVEYDATLWAHRDVMREQRLEARLHKQAAQRGYKLVPMEAAA